MQKNILIVDDYVHFTKSITDTLSKDYNIIPFSTKSCGKNVIRWINSQEELNISGAILDILINGISGLTIAKKLRTINPKCPIIFITGCASNNLIYQQVLDFINENPFITAVIQKATDLDTQLDFNKRLNKYIIKTIEECNQISCSTV